jgi:hypothetical protein
VGKAEVGPDNEYTNVSVPIYDPNELCKLEHSGFSQDEHTSLMLLEAIEIVSALVFVERGGWSTNTSHVIAHS